MERIKISSAKLKGDDGYKSYSIIIPEELCNSLDEIASKTGRSRNEIVTILLTSSVKLVDIE